MKKWSFYKVIPIYLSQAFSVLIPLLIAPLAINKWGIEVYGVYASLLTATQVGGIISEYSFDAFGPRLIINAKSDESKKRIYMQILVAKSLLGIVGLILSNIAGFVILNRLLTFSENIGVALVIGGGASFASWYLLTMGKITFMALLLVLSKSMTLVLMIVMLKLVDDVDGSLLFMAFSLPWGIIGAIVLFLTVNAKEIKNISISDSFRYIGDGRDAFIGVSGSALQNVLAPILIGGFSGASSVGFYSAVDRIARTISSGLKPIFQTLYPYMSRLHMENPDKAKVIIYKNMKFVMFIGVIIVGTSIYWGRGLLEILYGDALVKYSVLLSALLLWLLFGILNNFIGIQGLLAAGKDITYSKGIWMCLTVSAVLGLLLYKVSDYLIVVGFVIAIGELVALIYYIKSYASRETN